MEFVPLWTDIIDGPSWKILDLPADLYRFWTFCLMAAQKNDFADGFLPDERTLAHWCHMGRDTCVTLRDMLVTHGLIDRVEAHDGVEYRVHDWDEWRVVKDKGAKDRKRRQRAKEKEVKDASRGGHGSVTVSSENVTPHLTSSISHLASNNTPLPPTGDEVVEFGRSALGERFDLEYIGQKLPGWRAAEYSDQWIKDAMLVANCGAKPGHTASYMTTTLRRWKARGSPDPDDIRKIRPDPIPEVVTLNGMTEAELYGPKHKKGRTA